jgi:hypothetical protein
VKVTADKSTLAVGEAIAVKVSATIDGNTIQVDPSDPDLRVFADPSNAATITNGTTVTAVLPGSVTIYGTYQSIESDPLALTVTAKVLQAVSITPAQPSLPVGTAVNLSATGMYSDGTTLDITQLVSWATSDSTIASFVGNTLQGLRPGAFTLTVTNQMNGPVLSVQALVTQAFSPTVFRVTGSVDGGLLGKSSVTLEATQEAPPDPPPPSPPSHGTQEYYPDIWQDEQNFAPGPDQDQVIADNIDHERLYQALRFVLSGELGLLRNPNQALVKTTDMEKLNSIVPIDVRSYPPATMGDDQRGQFDAIYGMLLADNFDDPSIGKTIRSGDDLEITFTSRVDPNGGKKSVIVTQRFIKSVVQYVQEYTPSADLVTQLVGLMRAAGTPPSDLQLN